MYLTEDDLEQIADGVAQRLADRPGRLVNVAELADQLGVSEDFVYNHKAEFAMVRVGGAIRFHLDRTRRLLDEHAANWQRLPQPRELEQVPIRRYRRREDAHGT